MKEKSSLIIVFMFVGFVTFSLYSHATIDPKACVGAWLFDEGKGNMALDSSGNKNDGGLVNNPTWVDGKFGKALSFDGIDDYVVLPPITMNNWGGLTIVAWVWLNLLPNELPTSYNEIFGTKQDLVDMYGDRGNNEFRVKVTTTAGAERPGIPTAQLKKNQWLHMAGVFDGQAGQMKIYMNGQLMDTHNLSGFINGTQNSAIGAQGDPNGPFTDFHNGLIDEVALFNIALTEKDIQTIMNKGLKNFLGIASAVYSGKITSTWAEIKTQEY